MFISINKVKTTGFQPVSFSRSNFKKLTAKPICIIDAFSAARKRVDFQSSASRENPPTLVGGCLINHSPKSE
jgi:hypothetical protein